MLKKIAITALAAYGGFKVLGVVKNTINKFRKPKAEEAPAANAASPEPEAPVEEKKSVGESLDEAVAATDAAAKTAKDAADKASAAAEKAEKAADKAAEMKEAAETAAEEAKKAAKDSGEETSRITALGKDIAGTIKEAEKMADNAKEMAVQVKDLLNEEMQKKMEALKSTLKEVPAETAKDEKPAEPEKKAPAAKKPATKK